jgi:hypothetical protein
MFSIVFGSAVQIKYIVGMVTMPETHGTSYLSYLSSANMEILGAASLHLSLCIPKQGDAASRMP